MSWAIDSSVHQTGPGNVPPDACERTTNYSGLSAGAMSTTLEVYSRADTHGVVDGGWLRDVAVSSRLRAWRLSPPAREDRSGRPRALRCGSIRPAREGGVCSLVACGREWKQLGSLICPRDARASLQNGSCGTADQRSRPHPRRSAIFVVFSAITTGTPPRTRALAADPKRGGGTRRARQGRTGIPQPGRTARGCDTRLGAAGYALTRSPDVADLSMAAMTSWRRTASAKSGTVCVPLSMSAANAA